MLLGTFVGAAGDTLGSTGLEAGSGANNAKTFSSLNRSPVAGRVGGVRSDWLVRHHRERRVLERVRRARWRLEQAEAERRWALVSARAEGMSVRKIAEAAGLSATRVHQLTTGADLDAAEIGLSQLREAGWPGPEDPDGSDDEELAGREHIADRLDDEVRWLRQCAAWLVHLQTRDFPPGTGIRPAADWPERCNVIIREPRIAAILDRIAFDIEELARARRVQDLTGAAGGDDPRAERRRRLAEPDLDFRDFCTQQKIPTASLRQREDAWRAWQSERRRRGETDEDPWRASNPFRVP